MSWWNPDILNDHIAPSLSEFTAADIPDLLDKFPEARHWLADYFLNSVFRAHFEDPHRQLVMGFLRRTQHALDAYSSARSLTFAYLSQREADPAIYAYYDAIREWESCALNYSMAVELHNNLFGKRLLFVKGDCSPEESLYTIANQVKHTAKSIHTHPHGLPAVPLWLSNAGLHSYADVTLSYSDAAFLLTDMAELADKLRDPASLHTTDGPAG